MPLNTANLKRFAQSARRKLLEQVGAKMEYVLTHDTAELRERASDIKSLKEEIDKTSIEQVIEKVAYTWFNRLIALRFMDANNYQPSGIRIISPAEGESTPQILARAKEGAFEEEIPVNHKLLLDTIDGKTGSGNTQNEAFRMLLVAACNALHNQFSFLFERISDYTELLLPDDLTSDFSIVHQVVIGMTEDDCQEVEIIGWLYQFYISERKNKLITAKKKYKADEIAPVTQLFTPKWIVQYMVDNTLGQLWKEARPNTSISNCLEFYIKPNNSEIIPSRQVKSVEDISFFDPCVGSAHVLCYAFDVFYKMYEEEGYNPIEIPGLIITKNLYGIDIDDRAAQLASFALMMKGRKHYKRFFRKQVTPNITAFQNIESHPKFENAKVLGSLIKISQEEVDAIEVDETSLFSARDLQLKKQASLLADKYDVVATNPPYLNQKYMEKNLKDYIKVHFSAYKTDLFSCFIYQIDKFLKPNSLSGVVCPYAWMFLSSYFNLRKWFLRSNLFNNLVQLEYNAFPSAGLPICTFTYRKTKPILNYKSSFIRLSGFTGAENQPIKLLEAIKNNAVNFFYLSNQINFSKISSIPVAYWIGNSAIECFTNYPPLSEISKPFQGMTSSNNIRFLRFLHEVSYNKFSECEDLNKKWQPYNKGGNYRKWYGNYDYVINWDNNGQEIKDFTATLPQGTSVRIKSSKYFFKKGVTWSALGGTSFGARRSNKSSIFDVSGSSIFPTSNWQYLLGFLNCKITHYFINVLNPTLNHQISDIARLPIKFEKVDFVSNIVDTIVESFKQEWNSREWSWDFKQNELIRLKSQDVSTTLNKGIEEIYDRYKEYWKNKFFQLHNYEEELNKEFVNIYGLQNELAPEVPLGDLTILKSELLARKTKKKKDEKNEGSKWSPVWERLEFEFRKSGLTNIHLPFDNQEIFAQFISYAVGCMFGRYSLDKEGLILANHGETLQDFFAKVDLTQNENEVSFLPDDDAIIPLLNDEWFEDDIVGRFHEFLKISFSPVTFKEDLQFLEKQIGKDVRKWFVKDFYPDHIKRYKKRPIYWMFSSPKRHFNVLIYLHRYTPDTLSNILNNYLRAFIDKLKARRSHFEQMSISGTTSEQNKAIKEIDKLDKMIQDCEIYERDILYPLATERIKIDLDDGVLVNYNKFGKAVKSVKDLNDKKAKEKVRKFDWIDVSEIRD